MFFFEFHKKIKKLSPYLKLRTDQVVEVAPGQFITSLSYDKPRRFDKVRGSGGNWQARKLHNDQAAGLTREFISGVPTDWVPEFTVFNLEDGTILQKGWRDIIIAIVEKGYCSMRKARNVFTASLGESTYDMSGYAGKLKLARKGTEFEDQRSARQILADAGAASVNPIHQLTGKKF